jgi:putative SOS response-associated peptidase YedK
MYKHLALTADLTELTKHFQINKVTYPYKPQASIEPNQLGPVVVTQGTERSLEQYTWGIFPHWAKDSINAQSETVHEKVAYRKMFIKNRCVIPCSGFLGLKAVGKKNHPIRFTLKDQGIFGLAGLYDVWKSPRGQEFRTFTVLTTKANRLINDYHDSMPVILDSYEMDNWLNPELENKEMLTTMLHSFDPDLMSAELMPTKNDRRKKESAESLAAYTLIKD